MGQTLGNRCIDHCGQLPSKLAALTLLFTCSGGMSHAGALVTDAPNGTDSKIERAIMVDKVTLELIKGVGLEAVLGGVQCVEIWRGIYARLTECTEEDLAKIQLNVVETTTDSTYASLVKNSLTKTLPLEREPIASGQL